MGENHHNGADGILEDGVGTHSASAADLQQFDQASARLAGMATPRLYDSSDPNARMFVACFDGTWNDVGEDPEHATNVAAAQKDIRRAEEVTDGRIHAAYVDGIGTDGSKLERVIDGALGISYDTKLEAMYQQLMVQARLWKQENPNAEIRIADLGFSRGGEEAAGFARLVHERGIADPTGYHRHRDADGNWQVEYTKPPLVPPGQTPQALALFDPVGTGHPRDHDRRPPPSVVSGFQIVARDERRNLFQSTSILDSGMSPDGRFLSVTVPGAHSDVGGGYHRNGLSLRSRNLMSDYMNSLSDVPLVQKHEPPADSPLNVIHHSEDGGFFYRTSVFERTGERGRVEALAPRGTKGDRFNAEPRDEALAARFEFRPVAIAAVPGGTPAGAQEAQQTRGIDMLSPRDAELHRQSRAAVQRLDASMGRTQDEASDRVSAALLPAAREAGLGRIDHVARSHDGRTLFAVEGELSSPTNRMALIDARMAVATPVDTSLRALDTLNTEMERRASEQAKAQHAPSQAAPVRAMPAY